MGTRVKVTTHRPSRVTVARVEGDLDLMTLPDVERALRAAAKAATDRDLLAVDLSGVTYVNSAAIRLLYDIAEDLRIHRRPLRLVMSSEAPLRQLFRRLRFDTVVPVHDTVDDAIAEAGPVPSEAAGDGDSPRRPRVRV